MLLSSRAYSLLVFFDETQSYWFDLQDNTESKEDPHAHAVDSQLFYGSLMRFINGTKGEQNPNCEQKSALSPSFCLHLCTDNVNAPVLYVLGTIQIGICAFSPPSPAIFCPFLTFRPLQSLQRNSPSVPSC
jgi:hypothetical protein